MLIFLFVLGSKMLACVPSLGCHDIIGVPEAVILAGSFEFVGEFFGFLVYKRKCNKGDE